ncbi:MAG: hypothetical protein QGG40_20070, partial [Myxococcota bacterium]|nr:hypothetical protein [Myxococcota bacterium]
MRFPPIESAALARWLADGGHADPGTLALLSDGSPGRALALADGGVDRWRATRDDFEQVVSGSVGGVVAFAERT